ncbi:MAG: histidine kinase [Rubrobacter sp.]|nr:histidine kinase [Rubrobacter sp.]
MRHPRWLAVARVAWFVVAAVELVVFVASVRAYWLQLNVLCADPSRSACNFTQLTPVMQDALERLGFTVGAYAGYTLAIHTASSLALLAVGLLVFLRRGDEWYGLFVSLLLVTFGTIGPSAVLYDAFDWAYPELGATALALSNAISWLVFPALGLFLVTFPDGRFVPRWSFIVVLLWTLQAIFWEWIDSLPPPLFAAELLLVYGGTLAVQIYRYRRVSDATQRQQTKLVLFGFALGVSTIVVTGLSSAMSPGFASLNGLLEGTWVALLFTPIPLSIGVAVLKYRLWDVDPIINRTLVYGALTATVVAVYILIVAYLGVAFRTGGNLFISLVATSVVAVMFAPLRDRLQRAVNRLMYGRRDEPYAVLSRLGESLENVLAPEAALATVAESVAQSLKLPHVAITLEHDGHFVTAARFGTPVGEPVILPLTHHSEEVGRMVVSPRSPGEEFSAADRRLLDDLARQAGSAAHDARLTADLRHSRERLVAAREEERRRLRRDLHDGIGPRLATLALKHDAAMNLLSHDPDAVGSLLAELKGETQEAIADVRRVVHGLRPPALDQLGLVRALGEATRRRPGVTNVSLEAPDNMPPLSAAVEVAAYRIVQEALTNVARHAEARKCVVRLALDETTEILLVEVTDDGRGIGTHKGSGVGLSSMRERAEELGGSFEVEAASEGGTRVRAELPLRLEPRVESDAPREDGTASIASPASVREKETAP